MPEIKNTFIKSKMNKDLDARLLPNGEYRDAKNVSISRSEGSDVGALENVLGNRKLTSLRANLGYLEDAKIIARAPNAPISGDVVLNGLEIIGYYMDVTNDRIFLFLTDYSDASNDRLSNFAPADITYQYQPPGDPPPAPETAFSAKGAACYIVQYNVSNNQYRVLVGGNFLNFSKTHPIINVNMIENMLFWTDNRNQPRKINIDFANNDSYELSGANNPYYYNEDHISVAKFAPFESPSFLDTSNESGLLNVSTEFLPSHIINTLSSNTGSGGSTFNLNGGPYSIIGDNPDLKQGDKIIFPVQLDLSTPITSPLEYIISTTGANSVTISGTADQDIVLGAVFEIARANPIYDSNYKGDENLIKDKFIRFSYRFKYDDGEYSLMAPFTQAAFIPDQFGHFINDDETITAESTDVKFMENSVSKVKLNIKLPSMALLLKEKFKVKEIQILAKNSDELAVKVIENVPVSKLSSNNTVNYIYEYLSSKPIRKLTKKDLIIISDQIPIIALTQKVSGNRLIYGNFVNKHATPDYLEYDIKYKEKLDNNFTVEFPNHTVKQNRSYQVGVVLYDRYGRASNVILSDPDLIGANFSNSTVYARYSNFGTNSINYWGDYLEFSLKNPIPNSGKQGYPGLYSETNPLGYYTYRIVVKQQEQEYYNVYAPGALAGELLWDTKPDWKNSGSVDFINDVLANINDYLPRFIDTNRVSMISLFGDNINKVPRELRTSTNANDTTFGSETILFNRINPIYDSTNGSYNKQSSVSKRGEKVISIEPFKDLGAWTTTKGNGFPFGSSDPNLPPQPFYPYFVSNEGGGVYKLHYHDIFFNSQANPFIATIETDFKIGATPEYRSTQQNSDF